MTKEELGKQIETLRKECGVSTYKLEKKEYILHFLELLKKEKRIFNG